MLPHGAAAHPGVQVVGSGLLDFVQFIGAQRSYPHPRLQDFPRWHKTLQHTGKRKIAWRQESGGGDKFSAAEFTHLCLLTSPSCTNRSATWLIWTISSSQKVTQGVAIVGTTPNLPTENLLTKRLPLRPFDLKIPTATNTINTKHNSRNGGLRFQESSEPQP